MRLIITTVLGGLAGLLDAWLFLGNQLHDCVASSHSLKLLINLLHSPAMLLTELWEKLGGDPLFMFAILLILQWTIIGVVLGMWWQRKQIKQKDTQQNLGGDAETSAPQD